MISLIGRWQCCLIDDRLQNHKRCQASCTNFPFSGFMIGKIFSNEWLPVWWSRTSDRMLKGFHFNSQVAHIQLSLKVFLFYIPFLIYMEILFSKLDLNVPDWCLYFCWKATTQQSIGLDSTFPQRISAAWIFVSW